ncbi:MAG TPA: trypsin-like peptidase domain-containing protein [Polyangiaceae bacterium]|jgi:S1-C subfamily serine protease|nr:trypsin-like peptidase domain-containing protein [Polyangiaceae bacterium]
MSRLVELSRELETLVASTAPSVVSVEHRAGQGSGVIIADDGYVVTNAHVVRDERRLRIRFASGEQHEAELVGRDPATDLAVVRLPARGLRSLPLYGERRLRVGQLVVAIGNPLRFDQSATLGIVSAIDRMLPAPNGRGYEGLVQTDAAINPGNSGGPLLDASGAVVGINTAVIPFARGMGFAVPAHTANWVVALLMKQGHIERPHLGIAGRGVDLMPEEALGAGQSRAVRIFDVATESAADQAGLKRGDLLLAANAFELGSVDDLSRAMVFAETGAIELSLLRAGQRKTVSARPAAARSAA